MKELPRFPDDPRLTAYALGELDGDDRAAIEAALRRDPALRAALEELRAVTGRIEEALQDEAMLPAAVGRDRMPAGMEFAARPHAREEAVETAPPLNVADRGGGAPRQRLAFPQFYYAVGGFAAACLAVFVALRPSERPTPAFAPAAAAEKLAPDAPLIVTLPLGERSPAAIGAAELAPGEGRVATGATAGDVSATPADVLPPADPIPSRDQGGVLAGGPPETAQPRPLETPAADFRYSIPPVGSFALNSGAPLLGAGTGLRANPPPVIAPLADPPSKGAGMSSQAFVRARNEAKISLPGFRLTPAQKGNRSLPAGKDAPAAASGPPGTDAAGGARVDSPFLGDAITPEMLERARTNLAPSGGTDLFSGPRHTAAGGRREFGARGPWRRDSDFISVAQTTLSSPPIAVETASYPAIQRFLRTRQLPPAEAVRVEEMLNFFPIHAPAEAAAVGAAPFAVWLEVAEAPWSPRHRLLRIALRGREHADGAKETKLQVEFNPEKIAHHRLIGYENPATGAGNFPGEWLTAGELAAGQSLTLLYEVVLAGTEGESGPGVVVRIDELKYSTPRIGRMPLPAALANELMTLTVRYRESPGVEIQKLELPLEDAGTRFETASADFKFAAAVAAFGMILRNSPHKGSATMADVIAWASAGVGPEAEDPGSLRREFVALARQTQGLLRGE